MNYKIISNEDILFFQNLIGRKNVIINKDETYLYGKDYTENLHFQPAIVLLPYNTEQISVLVKFCNTNSIPITPRAAGTGLAGGALPIFGGVLLSLENLNKTIDIDTENLQVTVDAGVINYVMQEKLATVGLFFPPDPSSWQNSFIGGNIATNAGGPRAVKYGVTAQYVLNLQVVLPSGEIIWTGANTLKNSTGYNLTQLFVGSEGTLGIITKAVLKVLPKPKQEITLFVNFTHTQEAILAVNTILLQNLNPCVIEFIEKNAIVQALNYIEDFPIPFSEEINACLLISFDGNSIDELIPIGEKTAILLEKFSIGEILLADNETDKQRIWKLRRSLAEIVKSQGYTIEEDTVVPRSKLGDLVSFTHQLAQKNNCKAVCYGHAGDGNLHIRFNHPTHKNSYQIPEIQNMLKELFTFIYSLNGTISGEHGIGLVQKEYLKHIQSHTYITLLQNIKKTFDPNHIMNPNKIIDL